MKQNSLEQLFARYRSDHDLDALAKVFDQTAPQLRRLALRLNREQADDVVQDTFVRAIERAETWDGTRPLIPWLMGILTHRAQQAWRTNERTLNPDRLPERQVLQPEEVLGQGEFLELLEVALADLSPPLRQAVRGTLFDGKTPTQLAVDLGLQPGTIRQRLRRGLGQLRVALQANFIWLAGLFGLRSSGLAGVRARVLESAASQAPQGALALTGASSGMRWAGLVVLAVVGYMGVALWPDYQTAPGDGNGEAFLARVVENGRSAGPSGASGAGLVEVAKFGRLTRGEGEAVRVEVLWLGTEEPAQNRSVTMSLSGGEKRQVTTNGAGVARFELNLEDRPLLIAVDAAPQSPRVREYIGRSELNTRFTLYVHNGGSVSGQVLGPDEQPVPLATVHGWCGSPLDGTPDRVVQADERGRFTVEGLGNGFTLLAEHESTDGLWVGSEGLQGKVQPGEELTGHVLRLAPAGKMTGVVLLPDGKPAADVNLRIQHSTGSMGPGSQTHDYQVARFYAGAGSARSDANGRFEIEGLPPRQHHVTASLTPYLAYGERHTPGPEVATIQLDAGDSLQGIVVDTNGRPVLDAELSFWPFYGNHHTTSQWNPVAQDTGRFELRGMTPAVSRYGVKSNRGLIVRAPGYALFAVDQLPDNLDEISPLRIQLLPEGAIEGVVLDANGAPAQGYAVRIEGDRFLDLNYTDGSPHTWEKKAGRNELLSDSEGRFRFAQLYPGQFDVQVFADRAREKSLTQITRPGNAPLEFRLTPESLRKVVLVFEVSDALTGLPLTDFSFQQWIDDDGMSTGTPKTLAAVDGRWEVSGLEPGTFGIGIVSDGYEARKRKPEFYGVGEHEISTALWPLRSLEIRAIDQSGESMQGVEVSGSGPEGLPIRFLNAGGGSTSHYQMMGDRQFLHGLPAGLVTLDFEAGERRARLQLDLTLPRKDVVQVIFRSVKKVENIKETFLVWEFTAASELGADEAPTIPMGAASPAGTDPGMREFVRQAQGGKLRTPELPFSIVIKRPEGQRPVVVNYGPEQSGSRISELLGGGEAEKSPTSDSKWASPPMVLSVEFATGPNTSGSTLEIVTEDEPGSERDILQPINLDFPTQPGECFLQLVSEHYETIELRWFAEGRDGSQMPPTLLLKRKK